MIIFIIINYLIFKDLMECGMVCLKNRQWKNLLNKLNLKLLVMEHKLLMLLLKNLVRCTIKAKKNKVNKKYMNNPKQRTLNYKINY
jgi:hypothetical protein